MDIIVKWQLCNKKYVYLLTKNISLLITVLTLVNGVLPRMGLRDLFKTTLLVP